MNRTEKDSSKELKETKVQRSLVDQKLINEFKSGNRDAFNELVTYYRGKVYAMIYNMVHNEADAWDLTQDTFLKVWKALPKFRGEASFFTWLFRIAHNVTYDWLRKKNRAQSTEFSEEFVPEEDINHHSPASNNSNPYKELNKKETLQHIENAIKQLSYNHRVVIILKDVQGLSYKDIAEVLECSIGTVMSRLFYARKYLQPLLTNFCHAK